MDLAVETYALANKLPASERFGLASQIQRASISIPSNIAEGSKRTSRNDFRHFCLIALGSAAEVETQLELVERIYKIDATNVKTRAVTIQKMLTSLAKQLKISAQ